MMCQYRCVVTFLGFLLVALPVVACQGETSLTRQATSVAATNKDTVSRYYEEVWNKRNVDALAALFAGGLVDHACLASQGPGLDGFQQVISSVQQSYGSTQFTVEELIAEGDMVTARWEFEAEFAPNSHKVSFAGHETWRLEGKKIVERWGTLDLLSLMSQTFANASPIGPLPRSTGVRPTKRETDAVRRYYDQIWNAKESRSFQEAFAEDFVDHSPDSGQTPDLAGFIRSVEGFRDGFRNSRFTIDKLAVEGDKIRVNWTYEGNFPANDVPVKFSGTEVWIARDGRIKERWGEYDLQALVSQVGLITTPEARKRAAVQRYYEEVWNQGERDLINMLFADDFVDHSPDPGQAPGLAGFKESIESFRAGFPDSRYKIENLEIEGDKVTVDWQYQGTFAAMNKKITFKGSEIWTVEHGKIKERWAEYDSEDFLKQIRGGPPGGK